MKISDIIQQPEGRRLEFKEILPTVADLAKTMVAFANDAGGDLYIGIKNDPRALTGLPEDDLLIIEEQISNIIHDYCYPIIIPEIEFKWFEKGLQFQVQFVNKNYKQQIESQPELQLELKEQTLYSKVFEVLASKISSKKEVSEKLGQKEITGQLNVVMNKLVNDGLILRTIPEKSSSSKQQYYLSEKGKAFLSLIQNNSNNNI